MNKNLNVNNFLKAKTASELVELQLQNNLINSVSYRYQTPVYDGKNWYVWFFVDMDDWVNPENVKEDAMKMAKELNGTR